MQTVERYGQPVVSQLSYAALQEAREKELAYIAKVLEVCRKATPSDMKDELADLRAWLANRRMCFQSNTGGGK